MEEETRVLMKEKYLPDNVGILGGKITSTLLDGSIEQEVRVPFCDVCGSMLKDNIHLCMSCSKKLCPACKIVHENISYCRGCAQNIISVEKNSYKILLGITKEVNIYHIKRYSRMSDNEFEVLLHFLIEENYVDKKGISVFTYYMITDKGLSILPVCEQLFRDEGDMRYFIEKIMALIGEK